MECHFEIWIKYKPERKPLEPQKPLQLSILMFRSEMPCALSKGDAVDGLPGLGAVGDVVYSTWDFRKKRLITRLKDQLHFTEEAHRGRINTMLWHGWTNIMEGNGGDRG